MKTKNQNKKKEKKYGLISMCSGEDFWVLIRIGKEFYLSPDKEKILISPINKVIKLSISSDSVLFELEGGGSLHLNKKILGKAYSQYIEQFVNIFIEESKKNNFIKRIFNPFRIEKIYLLKIEGLYKKIKPKKENQIAFSPLSLKLRFEKTNNKNFTTFKGISYPIEEFKCVLKGNLTLEDIFKKIILN